MRILRKALIYCSTFFVSLGVGTEIAEPLGLTSNTPVQQVSTQTNTEQKEILKKNKALEQSIKKTDKQLAELAMVKKSITKDKKLIETDSKSVNKHDKKIRKVVKKKKLIAKKKAKAKRIKQAKIKKQEELRKQQEQEKQSQIQRQQEQERQEQIRQQEQAKQQASQQSAQQNTNPRGDFNTSTDGQGQIIGNRNSKIFHVPGQAGYNMNSSNIVRFNTIEEAIAAGYRQSKR